MINIQVIQAAVEVAAKVAEEYLPGGEEVALFFERAVEVVIQKQEEEKGSNQDVAATAAETWRVNHFFTIQRCPWKLD